MAPSCIAIVVEVCRWPQVIQLGSASVFEPVIVPGAAEQVSTGPVAVIIGVPIATCKVLNPFDLLLHAEIPPQEVIRPLGVVPPCMHVLCRRGVLIDCRALGCPAAGRAVR